MTATLSLGHLGCASTLNVHGDLIGLHSALQPCIDGAHGSSRAPSAARLLGLDTRCWTGERRAGGGRAAGTAVAQAGREDIADYALEWAVRTLWRARRAHHSRSGPRRDDMPSPAKAC